MKLRLYISIGIIFLSCWQRGNCNNRNFELQNKEVSNKILAMEYPFEINNLTNNLKGLLIGAKEKIDWTVIVEISEKEKIKDSSNVDLQFCYLFARFNEAKTIHIDDLKETTNFCLTQIKNYSLDTKSKLNFQNDLEGTLELIISKENEISILNSLNLELLNLKEKKELAFRLNDTGGVENYKKAAIIYHDLYNSQQELYNKFYNLGNEAICLFRSNNYLLGEEKFQILIKWDIESGPSAYPYIIDFVFTEMLLYNAKNKEEFIKLWNNAKSHNVIKLNDYFPISYPAQDKILKIVLDLDLKQALADLIANYEINRPKSSKSEETLRLIEKAKNAL